MKIRQASASDVEWLADCTRAAYQKYVPLLGREPEPMTLDYGQALDLYETAIAEESGERVGLLLMNYDNAGALIYSVAVMPEWQGQGVGKFLLQWAEERAVDHGCDCIRLYTNERMEENLALYRRYGYTETYREPRGTTSIVHMTKSLR
ncbi:GNAT family N-acetyltransferase [Chloroflexi bacterium TSY]|nr:GNAT family N-acetyltransferase [Chloroflexi bacterium TSY]